MAKYAFQDHYTDGMGRVVPSGTVNVYEAGTTTAATIYDSDGDAISGAQITTDDDGYFIFYVDDADYSAGQKFDIKLSKTNFRTKTYEDVVVFWGTS